MNAGLPENQYEIYQTSRFKKAIRLLDDTAAVCVEDEIDKIIANPGIGEQKKGDLSYLWVHKFSMNNQQVLLGYSWVEDKFELYLLSIGPHENFYEKHKEARKADLRLIVS